VSTIHSVRSPSPQNWEPVRSTRNVAAGSGASTSSPNPSTSPLQFEKRLVMRTCPPCSADPEQLFTAWSALGFDQGKLENGVLEPLRETKLID
jgi:hypothetical protein